MSSAAGMRQLKAVPLHFIGCSLSRWLDRRVGLKAWPQFVPTAPMHRNTIDTCVALSDLLQW